jgi:membrane associated rhomboid family serine protease
MNEKITITDADLPPPPPPPPLPQESAEIRLARAGRALRNQWALLLTLLALMWLLEGVDWFAQGALDYYGIHPRDYTLWTHIFWAPWLHGDFAHLAANSVPFLALGWFVLLRGWRRFVAATFWAMVIGGLGVWLIGRIGTVHLGSSILIFGYMGYLMAGAVVDRSLQALTLTLVALFLYGTMLWGVLPLQVGVSWEGHLFGFVGGAVAVIIGRNRPQPQIDPPPAA